MTKERISTLRAVMYGLLGGHIFVDYDVNQAVQEATALLERMQFLSVQPPYLDSIAFCMTVMCAIN